MEKRNYFFSAGIFSGWPAGVICIVVSALIAPGLKAQTGVAKGTPTFNCIGITWSGSGGNANTECRVQYRIAGSNSPFVEAYPLWFDSREVGSGTAAHRPANEYRGSIVGLRPGTSYHVLLTAGNARNEFISTTWSDIFPVGVNVKVTNSNKPLSITLSGTPNAYRLYSAGPGQTATIDIRDSADNCIYINASYVIVRGLILKNASEDAILLGPDAHDVIIENNDISGWGAIGSGSNNQAAIRVKGFSYEATRVERIVIQRNKIHHPRDNSNSWDDGGHPLGPNGINFEHAGGNHVIRYNEIYSDAGHYFMDGIGGADNFTFEGFPNANTDIYSNKISQCYDDGIESEGGNCNVRIWGNFTDYTFTSIASATNAIGPLYVFRNVSNVSQRSPVNANAATVDNEDRGPFNKCGSQDPEVRGGRTYLFHNTVLQPVQAGYAYPRGMAGGPVDNGGAVANIVSRNNIWQTYRENHPAIAEWQTSSSSNNSYDYDLFNGNPVIESAGGQEVHGIRSLPIYADEVPLIGPSASGYFLSPGSPGADKGVRLFNFNDDYMGLGPDIGAYENARPALQFGLVAGSNQPPIARTEENRVVPLDGSSTELHGNVSTDPDGVIVSYLWRQVAGPSQAVLTGAQTAIASVSNLEKGIYVFELIVTDNDSASSSTTLKLMVGEHPSLSLFPNPVNGVLNLQYASPAQGEYYVAIYDESMRLLWREQVTKDQDFLLHSLDVNRLRPGLYFSEIRSRDGREKSLGRFVKF